MATESKNLTIVHYIVGGFVALLGISIAVLEFPLTTLLLLLLLPFEKKIVAWLRKKRLN